jgi:hypothetical protein
MTKAEARMTKEGRMTKVEGKGGSDFGLCDSFVIRPSSFGLRIGSRASSFYFPALQKTTGKKSTKKTVFSSRKTAFGFRRFEKTAKTSRKRLVHCHALFLESMIFKTRQNI